MNNKTATPTTVAACAARRRLADGQLTRHAGSSRADLAAYVAAKREAGLTR